MWEIEHQQAWALIRVIILHRRTGNELAQMSKLYHHISAMAIRLRIMHFLTLLQMLEPESFMKNRHGLLTRLICFSTARSAIRVGIMSVSRKKCTLDWVPPRLVSKCSRDGAESKTQISKKAFGPSKRTICFANCLLMREAAFDRSCGKLRREQPCRYGRGYRHLAS